MRIFGPIGTAIISLSMVSPSRTPASKRSATMSRNPWLASNSIWISGYSRNSGVSLGSRVVFSTFGPQVIRTIPAGLSRSAVSMSNSASISSMRWPTDCSRRSPAAVTDTLRVVRVSRRICIRSSNPEIAWLSAGWVTPSCAAARVKLPSRATVMKESKSLRLRLAMFISSLFINFTYKGIKYSLAS